jgi:hypothetical protein
LTISIVDVELEFEIRMTPVEELEQILGISCLTFGQLRKADFDILSYSYSFHFID